MNIENKNMYKKISFYILSLLLIVLPVIIIPHELINFVYVKTGLVFLAVISTLVGLILNIMNERKVAVPHFLFGIPLILLPASYIVSSLLSKEVSLSLIGSGVSVDSAFFVSLMMALLVVCARFFESKKNTLFLFLAFIVASSVLFLFHILRFIFGVDFLSFGIFSALSVNTVGSFADLGILSGIVLILSVLTLDFLTLDKKIRTGLYISTFVSVCMLIVTNFNLVTGVFNVRFPISLSLLICVFSLFVFVHKKVVSPKESFPVASLLLFLIALICTVQIGTVTSFVHQSIGISPSEFVDVRITPESTFSIAQSVYKEGILPALFGSGPNTFYSAWAMYKSPTINQTVFWNQDFNLGSSYILTSLVTEGIVGILSWLILLILIGYSIFKLLKTVFKEKDTFSVYLALTVSSITIYLWTVLLLYTPSHVVIALTFMFTGILASLLISEGIVKMYTYSWEKIEYKKSFLIVFGLVILITALIGIVFLWVNKFVSSYYIQKAQMSLSQGLTGIGDAQAYVTKAISFNSSKENLRSFSNIHLVRPYELINKVGGVVPEQQVTNEVKIDINKAFQAAQFATIGRGQSPDYQDWIQFGKVNEAATFLGSTSTAEIAVKSYAQAVLLSPTNPSPLFLLGRMFVYAERYDIANEYLKNALNLKPDFKEVIDLMSVIKAKSQSNSQANTVAEDDDKKKNSTKSKN